MSSASRVTSGRNTAAIPALKSQEMHRCKDRGFCCGAGGARFWMEEKIGKRINMERTDEAIGLDPDVISTACPFCMVMLSDAVTAKKADGDAAERERDGLRSLGARQVLRAGPDQRQRGGAVGVLAAAAPTALQHPHRLDEVRLLAFQDFLDRAQIEERAITRSARE